ncbi:MAG: hypothetical protein ACKVSF_14120 [Alphaproteobacteria bacterium]
MTPTITIREPVHENPHTGLTVEIRDKVMVIVQALPGRMNNRDHATSLMEHAPAAVP